MVQKSIVHPENGSLLVCFTETVDVSVMS